MAPNPIPLPFDLASSPQLDSLTIRALNDFEKRAYTTGTTAGGVIGGIFIFLLFGWLLWFCCLRVARSNTTTYVASTAVATANNQNTVVPVTNIYLPAQQPGMPVQQGMHPQHSGTPMSPMQPGGQYPPAQYPYPVQYPAPPGQQQPMMPAPMQPQPVYIAPPMDQPPPSYSK